MQDRILVISASPVDFEDKEKKRVQGVSLHYIMPNVAPKKGARGTPPLKSFLRGKADESFPAVPGLYDGSFSIEMVDKTPSMKLIDCSFIGPVEYTPKAKQS